MLVYLHGKRYYFQSIQSSEKPYWQLFWRNETMGGFISEYDCAVFIADYHLYSLQNLKK